MDRATDPFIALADIPCAAAEAEPSPVPLLQAKLFPTSPVIAKLHGFDLLEQPLISDIPHLKGQVLAASSTVPLRRSMIGQQAIIWFAGGNEALPVIMGIIETHPLRQEGQVVPVQGHSIQADDERYVIQAEREVVLRCGESSITLTRAGKVIIKGNYILSRSTGYNKIKGAAIDIN